MHSVLIDLEKLKVPNCGLGQYSLHLVRAILRSRGDSFRPVLFVPRGRERLFPEPGVRFATVRPWKKERFVERIRPWLGPLVGCNRCCDLWHSTNQLSKYLPLDPSVPVIFTIHDLNFLHTDKSDRKKDTQLEQMQRKVDRAVALTAVSAFTASEVRGNLDLKGKAVRVIHNGATLGDDADAERPAFLPPGRFLFSIGAIDRATKNFHVLVDFLGKLPDYRLVIAGNHGRKNSPYVSEIHRKAAAAGVGDRLIMPGEIADATRKWLYQHCDAFLFPSLAEGFGLPVIEAMSCGKPVFMANATSLPEVGGPLGFYWESFHADDMARVFRDGMSVCLLDPDYSTKLQAHARQFSWERAAAGYISLYEEVLEG
jgi:glycosyltransferase involved in cell wall biosynthesis